MEELLEKLQNFFKIAVKDKHYLQYILLDFLSELENYYP